jgi:probable addiction module antidote protein
MVKTRPYDAAEFLNTPERIAAYLEEAFESGELDLILTALRNVARARGMTVLAKETGLARESLYRALDKGGNPEFATVMRVTKAFGLGLHVTARPDNSKLEPTKHEPVEHCS